MFLVIDILSNTPTKCYWDISWKNYEINSACSSKKEDAISVSQAFALAFKSVPREFAKTLTYDRETEIAEHKLFTKETKIQVFFADPHPPWQGDTNENTNGLIKQYLPKGTDFKTIPLEAIKEAERRLNSRLRKTLGLYTPSECFYELTTGQNLC